MVTINDDWGVSFVRIQHLFFSGIDHLHPADRHKYIGKNTCCISLMMTLLMTMEMFHLLGFSTLFFSGTE